MTTNFSDQVQLLVQLLPLVAKQSCFALKGGTAINLFVRDMPRLSVDIDLTYDSGPHSQDKYPRSLSCTFPFTCSCTALPCFCCGS